MPAAPLRPTLDVLGPGRGRFVVVEGIDGCGSTTQARRLRDWLERARGDRAFVTHEPSSGPVGSLVRLALSRRLVGAPAAGPPGNPPSAGSDVDPRTLALLFAADRVDHLENEVFPQLRSGAHAVSDRYVLSSLAYQGDRLPLGWVREINAAAAAPDLTVYLDVDVDVALERLARARWTRDLTEDEALLRRVLDRYRDLCAAPDPDLGPVVAVDGRQPADAVEREVRHHIAAILGD